MSLGLSAFNLFRCWVKLALSFYCLFLLPFLSDPSFPFSPFLSHLFITGKECHLIPEIRKTQKILEIPLWSVLEAKGIYEIE